MIRNKRFLILFISVLCVVGCKRADDSGSRRPIPVRVVELQSQTAVALHNYVGEVEEGTAINLSLPVAGKITEVKVKKNQSVREGDVLLRTDDSQYRNLLRAADATLSQVEDAYERMKTLYERGTVAEIQWIEMQTNLEKAQAAVAAAQRSVDDCCLVAPVSGIVSECNAQAGQQALPAQTMIKLIKVDAVNVSFAVPETEVSQIHNGDEARVCCPAADDKIFVGRVTEKDMHANRLAHTYQVRVAVKNTGRELLPGMVCKVWLESGRTSGFVLPAGCIQTVGGNIAIWTVGKQGMAERRIITSSRYVADGVLVSSGLTEGDRVVVEGYQKLYEGARVAINE